MSAAAGAAAGWFVSWLVGRATQVSSPIEAALTTIGSAAAVAALSWKFKTPGLLLLVYGTLVLVLIGVTVFDIRKHTIPHIVTIPGMITGLILGSFVLPLGVGRSVTGFLVGGGDWSSREYWGLWAVSSWRSPEFTAGLRHWGRG